MAFRLIITPTDIWTMPDGSTPRGPKYFQGTRFFAMAYGFQPFYLVGADIDAAKEAEILANSDVFGFPANLQATLSGSTAQQARDAYALALIPEQWINAGMTWQQVARTTAGMFQYMQRLRSYLGPNTVLIDSSMKLNVQFGSLPGDVQQAMLDTAADLGYSVTIAANTQVRQILKDMADQWGVRPFHFLEFQI